MRYICAGQRCGCTSLLTARCPGYALIDIWRKMLEHAYGGSSLSGCKLTGRKLPHAVCVPSINAPNYDASRRKMLG